MSQAVPSFVRRRRAIGVVSAVLASLLAGVMASPAGATHGFEIIRTVAGGGTLEGDLADGQPATDAALSQPTRVVVDGTGNYYFSEGNRVRKVDANGIITTVAGNGERGCEGDGGPATQAQLGSPGDMAFDVAGNLYVTQENSGGGSACENRVRKIDTSGTITTVGGSTLGCSGDGGPFAAAQLRPRGIFVDPVGNLYIADGGCARVARVGTSGTITTVAGIGDSNFSGDGGPATQARINSPTDVYVDSAGNLFIADSSNQRIRMVVAGADGQVTGTSDEIITTVVGSGTTARGFSGDGGPATQARLSDPTALDFDPAGNLYIADTLNNRIRKVVPGADGQITGAPDEIITTFAGGGSPVDGLGDGGPPAEARLSSPEGVAAADPTLGVLIADTGNDRIRQVIFVPDLLAVTKAAAPNPVDVGEELTYTIEVANNGGPATGATVTDTLPADVDFVSAEATQGSCAEAAGTVTCELGGLAPDSGATVTIVVIPTVGGTAANTVTVDAAEADPLPANNSATTETGVNAPGCGQVITANATLQADIGPCQTDGIIIGADNITLNLNGHRIFGAPGPGNGNQAGVRLPARSGVTIRGNRGRTARGTIDGFDAGVLINGGSRNTVTSLVLRDNIGPEGSPNLGDGVVLFNSALNQIIGNVVTQNGPYDNIGVLGVGSDNNLIQGNLVTEAFFTENSALSGLGITTNPVIEGFTAGAQVFNNRIIDNTVRDNPAQGISSSSSTNAIIRGNLVENNGLVQSSPGNGIGVRNNLQAPRLTNVRIEGNTVRGNDQGIEILTDGNEVIGNEVVGNNSFGLQSRGRDNEISGNKFNGNGGNGVQLFFGRGETISGNEVNDNGGTGIFAFGVTNTRILRNDVHANAETGIELAFATGNKIRYNDAADNVGTDLVDSFADCDNNVWAGNIWGSGGFSPPCVTKGGSGPPPPAPAAAASSVAPSVAPAERTASPQPAESPDPPVRRAPPR